MKKRWIVGLASLSATAGVVALALFLAGVFDGEDSATPREVSPDSAAQCAEDAPDCDKTLAAEDEGGGITSSPVCAPDFPDCKDMVVLNGDDPVTGQGGVDIEPVCLDDVLDCGDLVVNEDTDGQAPPADPIRPVDGRCSGDAFASCEQQATDAVLADAKALFGVDESEIEVEGAAFQEWSNSCLDAANEGEACAEVTTPGFVIVIEFASRQYEYHTDLNGNVRLAP